MTPDLTPASRFGTIYRMKSTPWEVMFSLIADAKGGDHRSDPTAKSWGVIAREARNLPGAPTEISPDSINYLRRLKGGGVLDRGPEVRALAAAVDLPLVDLLAAGDWWPDLRWGAGISTIQRVAEGLRVADVAFGRLRPAPGRIIIDL